MPQATLPQFGAMAGASISVDGVAFDGAPHKGPKRVAYTGPEQFTAVSGRPFLQGPVTWTCTWDVMVLDDLQALYTLWNIKLNSNSGPRVSFGLNDPRLAGAWQEYDCWMDEPTFEMAALYVRNVSATFTTVIE